MIVGHGACVACYGVDERATLMNAMPLGMARAGCCMPAYNTIPRHAALADGEGCYCTRVE